MNDLEFDALLDGVLQEDGRVEPLHGLEARVLARVRMQARRRWTWSVSVWSSAVAVMCLLAVVVWTREVRPVHGTSVAGSAHGELTTRVGAVSAGKSGDTTLSVSAGVQLPRKGAGRVQRLAGRAVNVPEPLPKLDVFPTPIADAGSGTEMQAMLRLAELSRRGGSEAVSDLVAGAQEHNAVEEIQVRPISIARIEIAPLGNSTEDAGQ